MYNRKAIEQKQYILNKLKEDKAQPKISEAFGKQMNIKENLPNVQSAMKMWKKLDKEAEKLGRSEIKEKKLKIETFTRTTKMNVKPENKQHENKQQQTKKNNNENITTTTTMKNLKMKTLEPKQDDKPNMNKTAKPNSKQLKVKGKPISDIE